MKITETAFVVYPVTDMAEARRFYSEVLGLPAGELDHDQWLEFETPEGFTFALTSSEEFRDDGKIHGNGAGTIAFEVDDLDDAWTRMQEQGVACVTPLMEFPTCRMFVIQDPSGNSVILHKRAEQA